MTIQDIINAFNKEEEKRVVEAAEARKKQEEENKEKEIKGTVVQVLREVQTYSTKAFDFMFRGNEQAGVKAFFGSIIALGIAALSATPAGWFAGIAAVVGLFWNLIFNHPGNAVTDSQRIQMLQNSLNGLMRIINAS